MGKNIYIKDQKNNVFFKINLTRESKREKGYRERRINKEEEEKE